MIKNRFFKTTPGVGAELAIVTQVDATDGTAANAQPSMVSLSLGVGASPTTDEDVTFTFSNGKVAYFKVPAASSTASVNAGVKAALEAALSDVDGASVSFTGTTTMVISIGVPGAAYNAVTITTTETGTTFTAPGVATFAGGVNADAVAADNIKDFSDATSNAGSIWAYWEDTNLALVKGDTAKPENANRKFYYAWKQADAKTRTSSPIPVKDLKYDSKAYTAGTAQVSTATFTGTFNEGQWLHVKIVDKTRSVLPYNAYQYSAKIGSSGINQAVADIATAINAEKTDPIVTGSSSTNVLTVTGKTKNVFFDIVSYVETTATYPTDLGICTVAVTTKALDTIGDTAYVKELEEYYRIANGGVNYVKDGLRREEFGDIQSNIGTNSVTQWGILLVTNERTEKGIVRDYAKTNYMIIAIKNTDLSKLAEL